LAQAQSDGPRYRPSPSGAGASSAGEGQEPLEMSSTRIHLSTLSGSTTSPTDNLNFSSYTGMIEQDLGSRITLVGSIPIIMGSDNGKTFNEWGNPFAGASIRLIELQSYHPLWLIVHGGFRFAQTSSDNIVAPYQEIHTGASLIKHFSSVELITDGNYIQKTNDPQPGLVVGNELDAYTGLKVGLGDGWAIQAGYMVRHADPTKQNNVIVIGEDIYTATDMKLSYRITPSVELTGKFQLPLESESIYSPNLAAFGDLITQASLGKSWSVGLNVGL
jgi:hypothetical protein